MSLTVLSQWSSLQYKQSCNYPVQSGLKYSMYQRFFSFFFSSSFIFFPLFFMYLTLFFKARIHPWLPFCNSVLHSSSGAQTSSTKVTRAVIFPASSKKAYHICAALCCKFPQEGHFWRTWRAASSVGMPPWSRINVATGDLKDWRAHSHPKAISKCLRENFEVPLSQISLPVPGFCSNTQKPVAQRHDTMDNSLNRISPVAASPISYSIVTQYCTHCILQFCPCLRTWLHSEIASDMAGCADHHTRSA